jgi:hypothetical protein
LDSGQNFGGNCCEPSEITPAASLTFEDTVECVLAEGHSQDLGREVEMPTETEPILTLWSLAAQGPSHAELWEDLFKAAYRVLEQPGRKASIRKYSREWLENEEDINMEMAKLLVDNFFDEFGSLEISAVETGGDVRAAWQTFIDAPWTNKPLFRNGVEVRRPSRMEHVADRAGSRNNYAGTIDISIDGATGDSLLAEIDKRRVFQEPSPEEIDQRRQEQIKRLEKAIRREIAAKAHDKRYQQQNAMTVALTLLEIMSRISSSTDLGEMPSGLTFKSGEPNWSALAKWLNGLNVQTTDKTVEKATRMLSRRPRAPNSVPSGGCDV